jgi:c-di-GMP-related signal transduction protein
LFQDLVIKILKFCTGTSTGVTFGIQSFSKSIVVVSNLRIPEIKALLTLIEQRALCDYLAFVVRLKALPSTL